MGTSSYRFHEVIFLAFRSFTVALALLLVAGCFSDNEEDDAPGNETVTSAEETAPATTNAPSTTSTSYPRIKGKWSGVYYRSDGGGQSPVTATITQNREAVTISTSRQGATAGLLTGTIDPSGRMVLTDALDGETWTTYYGPANENYIKVADFVRAPEIDDIEPVPLYILELSR